MQVLKYNERSRTVRLRPEIEQIKPLFEWVYHWDGVVIEEYQEEAERRFPDGMTFDEVVEFLESK